MKNTSIQSESGVRWNRRAALVASAVLLGLLAFDRAACTAWSYPPAPHHLIYGIVRDELGNPLQGTAEIILETSAGVQIKGSLVTGRELGVNYELKVAMDAGLTSDLYRPTALQPTVPFKLKVRIGDTSYLPIQMTANYVNLGLAGQRTRLDLTLGEDLDGDGLPDAWERLTSQNITNVKPGDLAGNGMTYLQNYVAGTYAFDPAEGFKLNITGVSNGRPLMKFLAIRGRAYTLLGSTDLKTWVAVAFRIPADDAADVRRANYAASEVRPVEIEAASEGTSSVPTFFKLLVQ